ncbi:MAG: GC-type dockerin domain-anchored protein [Phycisphaerales bacterium]
MNAALSLACILLAAGTSTAAADILNPARARTVATDGQNAPSLAGLQLDLYNAASPSEYSTPSASASGVVGFFTALTGTGVVAANNEAAYLGLTSGTLALVLREGSQAPGLPAGVNYGTLTQMLVNSPTQLAISTALAGAGVTSANNAAIWYGDPAALAAVAVKGSPAAGFGSLTYAGFDSTRLSLSSDGYLVISGTLGGLGVTTANDKALWIVSPAAVVTAVAREGDPAPGMPAGALFANFLDAQDNVVEASATTGGNTFAFATVTGGGTTASNDNGIWYGQPGALTLLVREGDPAPTLASPIILSTLTIPGVNSSGNYTFVSGLSGTGTSSTNNLAVYRATPAGVFTIIARKGSPAPGYPTSNLNAVTAANRPRINNSNQVLVQGTLTGGGATSNDDSFLALINADGTSLAVAREGQQYPDLPAGVVMNGTFGLCTLASNGTVVFSAVLRGTGVVAGNNDTLWSWSPANGLRLIAREGESMLVSSTETRTPASTDGFDLFGGTGNGDGFQSSVSNAGDAAIRSFFTDGSTRILVLDTDLFACGAADLGGPGGLAGYDGLLNNNDFIAFIDLFFNTSPLADLGVAGGLPGHDGVWDNNDFIAFISFFFNGCS